MKHRLFLPALLLACAVAAPAPVRAQAPIPTPNIMMERFRESERRTLAGVDAVYLVVEKLAPAAREAGLAQADLENFAAERLMTREIRLLTNDEFMARPETPMFYVNPIVLPLDSREGGRPGAPAEPAGADATNPAGFAVALAVELRQRSLLERDTAACFLAPSWQSSQVVQLPAGEIRGLLEVLGPEIDRFAADWRRANPKKATESR